jgi:hypothetical protein
MKTQSNRQLSRFKLKTQDQSRDRLFFDAYEYCFEFHQPELNGVRHRSHSGLQMYVKNRQWMKSVNWGGSWNNSFAPDISNELLQDLHQLVDHFNKIKNPFVLRISYHKGYFYTNNLQDIESILEDTCVRTGYIRRAVVDLPRGSMRVKNAKHAFRTYFKNQKIETQDKHNLHKFLQNQHNIRIGPGFKDWLENYPYNQYVYNNFFIDYDDTNLLTLITLTSGIKVKRTVDLIAR